MKTGRVKGQRGGRKEKQSGGGRGNWSRITKGDEGGEGG